MINNSPESSRLGLRLTRRRFVHFYSDVDKRLLGVFLIFELRPDSESLWKSASDEPIRFGDKAIFRPKKLTWNLSFWDFWFGKKTPWCRGIGPKDSLVGLRSYQVTRGCLSGNCCGYRSGAYQVMQITWKLPAMFIHTERAFNQGQL